MEAFRKASVRSFEERLMGVLRLAFTSDLSSITDDQIRNSIYETCKLAQTFGMRAEEDIATLAFLQQMLGRRFDLDPQRPWAGETLNDQALSAGSKIQILAAYAEDELGSRFVPMRY